LRLFPQDLGNRWHLRFVLRRNAANVSGVETAPVDPPHPHMGLLGRFYARGSGLTPEQAARALPASGSALGSNWGVWGVSLFTGLIPMALAKTHVFTDQSAMVLIQVMAAFFVWLGAATGRRVFQSYHKPLKPGEVAAVLAKATDPLDLAFLELVHDAVRLPGSAQSEEQLRAAITSLAEALERLPMVQAEEVDTASLRQEASEVLVESRHESDPVLAESLARRWRALLQRAESEESAQTYARRTAGLRAELLAQTEALRSALRAFDPCSPGTSSLVPLAEAALALNQQAFGLASARAELAESLTPKSHALVPETVQVGRTG
jgi:hypothetical protein